MMIKEIRGITNLQHRRSDSCHRCGGLMVPEKVFELGAFDWRCVSCGERIDPVILAHRHSVAAGGGNPYQYGAGRARRSSGQE